MSTLELAAQQVLLENPAVMKGLLHSARYPYHAAAKALLERFGMLGKQLAFVPKDDADSPLYVLPFRFIPHTDHSELYDCLEFTPPELLKRVGYAPRPIRTALTSAQPYNMRERHGMDNLVGFFLGARLVTDYEAPLSQREIYDHGTTNGVVVVTNDMLQLFCPGVPQQSAINHISQLSGR